MALALARLVRTLAGIIALIIVVAIVLFLVGANPSNQIVSAIHDAGAWLAGPFKNLFSIHNAKLAMAVNWGLADLQDSMMPVEVGDRELREGLSETREAIADLPSRARRLMRAQGR